MRSSKTLNLRSILDFFTFRMEGAYDSVVVSNVFVINIFTLFGGFFVLVYGLIAFLQQMYLMALLLGITVIAVIGNFIYLKYSKNHIVSSYFVVSVLSIMLVGLMILSPPSNGSYLWYFIIPPVALFLLGFQMGTRYIMALFFFAVCIFFFPPVHNFFPSYTIAFESRFLSVYSFVAIMSAFIIFRNQKQISRYKTLYFEAENSTRTKTEIILRLSHHIRTSLNNITGLIPLLKTTTSQFERDEHIATINNTIQSLVKEVDQIQSVLSDKTTSSEGSLYFPMNQTIERFLSIYKESEFVSSVDFTVDLPDNFPVFFYGNDSIISKILFNITETIWHYSMEQTPKIHLKVFSRNESSTEMELFFELSTSSIEVEKLYRLAGPQQWYDYFDGKIGDEFNSREEYLNLYNLSISLQLLKTYKGNLGVKPSANDVVFWFSLVMQKSNVFFPEIPSPPEKEIKQQVNIIIGANLLADASVLIAEDNYTNQQILYLGLKSKVGQIDMAIDGSEAIELFIKKKYDIVLLDLQMPIMDGFKTAEKIREMESGTPVHTPIIAITANVYDEIRKKCKTSGFDDYLEKPYRVSQLLDRMQEQLQKYSRAGI